MEQEIRWAAIGVGKFAPTRGGASAIAYAHAEAVKRNAGRFELVAASARTAQSREDFAREYPCRTYADFRELLAKERPDGVALSTCAPDRVEHLRAILVALYLLGDGIEVAHVVAGAEGLGEVAWQGTRVERRLTATVFLTGGEKLLFTAAPETTWSECAIRVVGERGMAELWADKVGDMKSVVRIVTPDGVENPALDENFHHGDVDRFLYFERAYRDMGAAISSGGPCRLDFAPGLLTQRILLDIYAAAKGES